MESFGSCQHVDDVYDWGSESHMKKDIMEERVTSYVNNKSNKMRPEN